MPSDPSLWISPQHISRPELLQSSELAEQVRALNLQSEPYKSVMALDRALREAFETRSADGLKSKQEAAFAALTKTEGYLSPALLRLDHFKTGLKPYKQASYVFLAAFLAFLAYLVSTRRPKSLDSTSDNSHNGTTAAVSSRTLEPAPAQAMASAPILGSMARQELALAGGPPLSGGGEPIFFRREIESVDEVLKAEQEVSSGNRLLWTIAYGILTFGCLLLLGALIARFALGGRMPVSNMFEAVTFALTSFALLAVIAEGIIRRGWIGISGAFLGWTLMMAVNLMPMNAKKVEPLIAVLDSIWLNYHVTSLLISYSCFLLAFAFSVIQIVKLRFGNRAGLLPRAEVFEHLAFRSTQVGWPLLTLGIFLGAVWANTAWGSYWSWDPKETWALITFFGYTIYLHMRMIVGWNGEKAAWLNIVGFVLVLITFFGVSYLPGLAGGMHSYANPISR
jgi:cytochrome c-type biogenesis protein CcsB